MAAGVFPFSYTDITTTIHLLLHQEIHSDLYDVQSSEMVNRSNMSTESTCVQVRQLT